MRVAALDVGKVRIGLAVSDELGMLAHPRPALDGRDRRRVLRELATFAREESVDRFVVGLPLDAQGREGPAARSARAFADQVAEATGCPVDLWDERFTTVEATRRLREGGHSAKKSRQRVDGAAACVMLQAWLEGRQGQSA
jgi:putative Holliday junction resolvase